MEDNSQILKLMRMMNSTPKYWILSPDAVMTGSYDDGRPLLPPGEAFENKIVLTIPKDNPSILCEYIYVRNVLMAVINGNILAHGIII